MPRIEHNPVKRILTRSASSFMRCWLARPVSDSLWMSPPQMSLARRPPSHEYKRSCGKDVAH